MIPIVYINLDRDVDRRQHLERQLERLGLSAHRIRGVLWSELTPQEQSKFYSSEVNQRKFYRPLSDGEKGCYVSHLYAARHAIEASYDRMLILEDDVILKDGLPAVLKAIERLPVEGWDIIKLYSRQKESPRLRRPLSDLDGYELCTYKRVPSWSNAYVVSQAGARKLCKNFVPFGRPIDVDKRYWWEFDLRILGILPSVVEKAPLSKNSSIWSNGRSRRTWPQQRKRWYLQLVHAIQNAWMVRGQELP